ncbi:MAG: cyanophycinase [Planctomycetota bacterium]|nr:cyanophycinase [Planctomycetota bacterium]
MKSWIYTATLIFLSFGFVNESFGQSADYQLYRWGSKSDKACRGLGGVFLGGGGRDVDEGMKQFVKNAGGGDIVVLRASGSDGYQKYLARLGKVNSVVTIVFKSRKASFDKRVIEIVKGAEGIFLAGGRQDRYYQYWEKTPIAKLLQSCHERKIVLGGTSAGLAVLGEFCFAAKAGGVRSETLLKNPAHDRVSLEKGFIHSKNALYRNILFDSHFSERKRLGRFAVFLSTLRTKKLCANPIGIGIDEATALFVDEHGYGRVFGRGRVQIVMLKKATVSQQLGQPFSASELKMARLQRGQSVYLPNWAISGGERGQLSIKKGVLEEKLAPLGENLSIKGPDLGQLGQPLAFFKSIKGSRKGGASLLIRGVKGGIRADSKGMFHYSFQKTGRYQVHIIVDEARNFPILSRPLFITIKP